MYKFGDNQLSLTNWGQAQVKLNPENRWINKAQSILWEEIEMKYAKLFTNKKGNVAKPLRLALGACIIRTEYGYSIEKTALHTRNSLCFFSRLAR